MANSLHPKASHKELWSWAMYDFANSSYTTVVLTTIYNVYFVTVVAGQLDYSGTFLWTLAIGAANAIVLFSAPVIGAIADRFAIKKILLAVTTLGCVISTALLSLTSTGDLTLAMVLVIASAVMFASGENLIAAFLPELSEAEFMGRLSGYAWGLGYCGGITGLLLCLAYIGSAEARGQVASDYVPTTMLIVAGLFAFSALPTFLFVRERAIPRISESAQTLAHTMRAAWSQTLSTIAKAHHYRDLFQFLLCLILYQSGIATVVVLSAVYADQVIGLSQKEIIILILVVNVTAAIGAISFGLIQDKMGSVKTVFYTLLLWIGAVLLIYKAQSSEDLWIAGNLIGFALGASQSAGRALVGQFTPVAQTAEFFGLWGLATKLAAILGPVSYGLINYLSGGNHQIALLSTLFFFIAGAVTLFGVNEQRGRTAAGH